MLVVFPVKDKSKTPQYVRRMLRLSKQYLDIKRVYLDAGSELYNSDTISTITEHGLELVMQGRKSGETIKHFLNGMARADLHYQGRYAFTANQFMVAMLLDMEDIEIGEVRDLSVRSNIVREVFRDGYPFKLESHPEFEN